MERNGTFKGRVTHCYPIKKSCWLMSSRMETRTIWYKSWNATIATWCNGNMVNGDQKYIPNCTLLFLSSVVTPHLWAGLRIELQLLSISEMGTLYTLTLTVGNWSFDITLPRKFRHFIPESWNFLKGQFCCFLDKKIHKFK